MTAIFRLFICFWFLNINLSWGNNQQINQLTNSDSTFLAFHKGSSEYVKIIETERNKYIAQLLTGNDAAKQIKISKKNVFNIQTTANELIPQYLRFIYYDSELADDVVKNGKVLGFNSEHFLIEFTHNGRTLVTVKHKSAIVQKDLSPK